MHLSSSLQIIDSVSQVAGRLHTGRTKQYKTISFRKKVQDNYGRYICVYLCVSVWLKYWKSVLVLSRNLNAIPVNIILYSDIQIGSFEVTI